MAIYGTLAACGVALFLGLVYVALMIAIMADPPRRHDGRI